jgi:hypothetical protein
MNLMNLKMLIIHHIQIALIITSWKKFWIFDSKDEIHNDFGSDTFHINFHVKVKHYDQIISKLWNPTNK